MYIRRFGFTNLTGSNTNYAVTFVPGTLTIAAGSVTGTDVRPPVENPLAGQQNDFFFGWADDGRCADGHRRARHGPREGLVVVPHVHRAEGNRLAADRGHPDRASPPGCLAVPVLPPAGAGRTAPMPPTWVVDADRGRATLGPLCSWPYERCAAPRSASGWSWPRWGSSCSSSCSSRHCRTGC